MSFINFSSFVHQIQKFWLIPIAHLTKSKIYNQLLCNINHIKRCGKKIKSKLFVKSILDSHLLESVWRVSWADFYKLIFHHAQLKFSNEGSISSLLMACQNVKTKIHIFFFLWNRRPKWVKVEFHPKQACMTNSMYLKKSNFFTSLSNNCVLPILAVDTHVLNVFLLHSSHAIEVWREKKKKKSFPYFIIFYNVVEEFKCRTKK